MKKLTIFFLLFLVAMASCKKSESDNNNSSPDGKKCKLLTASTIGDFPSTSLYVYDSSGNLTYVKHVDASGDTLIDQQYKYTSNVLQYSFIHTSSNFSDTTFYFYDVNNRLESTVEHYRTGNFLLTTRIDYVYNSENQVIHTLSHATGDSINYLVDSILYSYTGKNVARYTRFSKSGSGTWYSTIMNISYDNMKSYMNSMGMPATTYFYWSENNITKMINADSTNAMMTINYTKYNESGYPIELTAINDPTQHDTVTEFMTYLCK